MKVSAGRRPLIALLCALVPIGAVAVAPEPAARSVRIGVLAHRPKDQVQAGWQPLAEALERALPRHRFTVAALTYPELEAAIAARRIDLVITNPSHYVAIRTQQPMTGVLATVIEQTSGEPLANFGGTILARADRGDLAGLSSLVGARIAAVGLSSLGGYQAQVHALVRAGLDPPEPARVQFVGVPHDRVVERVLAREADVGFVRSGTLETMAAEGRLDLGQVKVLNRQAAPGFPYAVSTPLYPDWPVVALAHLDDAEARRIAAALLVMEHSAGGDRAAAFHGFAVPADYAPVEALLRDLRLPPFEAAPAFEAADVLRRYRAPIAALAVAALVIGVLAGFLAMLNRRLARARREASEVEEELRRALSANEATLAELREAASRVKQLSGLLPICMYCHKIRTDQGYWDGLEGYISAHSEAQFSHGICPKCLDQQHPGAR